MGVTQNGIYHKLSDGEDLQIIHGPQGGIHVLISLRLTGFHPGEKFTVSQYGTMNDTGDVVAPEASILVFKVNADGTYSIDDQRVYLRDQPSSMSGRRATLTLTVSSPKDQNLTVSASVVVTLTEPTF